MREDSAELVAAIAGRMRAARESLNMGQAEAAHLLGLPKAARLAKIERGEVREIPVWIVTHACRVYGVSADYLMGSDERARRPGRPIPGPILDAVCRGLIRDTARRRAEADALIDAAKHWQRVRRLVGVVAPLADELAETQDEVEQEDAWQDVRGGARMAEGSRRAIEALRGARELVASL